MTQSISTKLFYANKAGKKRTRVNVTEQFYSDVKTMTNMMDTTTLVATDIARIFNCGIATISRIKVAKDYADYIAIVQRDSQWATVKAKRIQAKLEKVSQESLELTTIGTNVPIIKLTDTETEIPKSNIDRELLNILGDINTTLNKLVNAWTETPKKTGWLK